jgi:hypothetical protein
VRHMSFSLTTPQMRARTKTVTRRLASWQNLQPGTLLLAVEKSQGLRKGEKVRRIGVIRVVDVRREPLHLLRRARYGRAEARREGFPELTGVGFLERFCAHAGCSADALVTRIEFEHVEYAANA